MGGQQDFLGAVAKGDDDVGALHRLAAAAALEDLDGRIEARGAQLTQQDVHPLGIRRLDVGPDLGLQRVRVLRDSGRGQERGGGDGGRQNGSKQHEEPPCPSPGAFGPA
ncbi:hypothetical protein D3C72_2113520 [compost metagenome]